MTSHVSGADRRFAFATLKIALRKRNAHAASVGCRRVQQGDGGEGHLPRRGDGSQLVAEAHGVSGACAAFPCA